MATAKTTTAKKPAAKPASVRKSTPLKATAKKPTAKATPKPAAPKAPRKPAAKEASAAAVKRPLKKTRFVAGATSVGLEAEFVKGTTTALKPGEYDLALWPAGTGEPKMLRAKILGMTTKRRTREQVARGLALLSLYPAQALLSAKIGRGVEDFTVSVTTRGVEDPTALVVYSFKLKSSEMMSAGKDMIAVC